MALRIIMITGGIWVTDWFTGKLRLDDYYIQVLPDRKTDRDQDDPG
jgi:hypothetical protein